jgi:chorismate synthase
LENDFDRIGWTFMPLMRQNANFNLYMLGAQVRRYHPNHYGEMKDGLNAGMPSDRLVIDWDLQNPRVMAHATGEIAHLVLPTEPEFLLVGDEAGEPQIRPTDWQSDYLAIEIPYDTQRLMRENLAQAQRWSYAVREVFLLAFERHYAVIDFVTREGRCWYVLRREKA